MYVRERCTSNTTGSSEQRAEGNCADLHKLGVVPADFPNAVLAVKTNEQLGALKRKLLTAFDRKLNPSPMNCDPMSITLQPDAIPICVTTARVKENYNRVDRTKGHQPGREPTTRCSPAFFVPKADGKRVRLATDFTALNKFIQRPRHPFPSTREIIEAIPLDAKLLCKLDAVHGYFQLALDDKSSKLIPHTAGTFQIPASSHGTKRIIRQMVSAVRCHNTRPPICHENCRRYNNLDQG